MTLRTNNFRHCLQGVKWHAYGHEKTEKVCPKEMDFYKTGASLPNCLLMLPVDCGIGLNPDEINNIPCHISAQTGGLTSSLCRLSLHTILIS